MSDYPKLTAADAATQAPSADQGARGPAKWAPHHEHLRAELQTLTPEEISARTRRGDYDGLLRGDR